jgi:ADYC domain
MNSRSPSSPSSLSIGLVGLAGLALLASLASCVDEAAAPLAGTARIEQHFAECDFACGDNGGMIDGVFFWELNLGGAVGASSIAYRRFARSELDLGLRRVLRLDVLGGRLRALDSSTNTWIEGTALAGGVMEISVAGKLYLVKIAAVHTGPAEGQPYWTKTPANRELVETYTLRWAVKPPDLFTTTPVYTDVCATTTPPDEPWTNQLDALVFDGERYDVSSKEITAWPTTQFTSWFNVACAGSLPAKMHLVRRTAAASNGLFTSTIEDDRQAFARMWAADYCGTGETFTITGHKLRVRDRKTFQAPNDGWLAEVGPVSWSAVDATVPGFSYEAVWDADGAVCLEAPRLVARAKIETACGRAIPRCSDQSWFPGDWKSHGMLLSANPAP